MSLKKIVTFNIKTLMYELLIARIAFGVAALIAPLTAGVLLYEHIELLSTVNFIRFGAAYTVGLFFLHLNIMDKRNALRIRKEIDSGKLKAFTYLPSSRFAEPEMRLIETPSTDN